MAPQDSYQPYQPYRSSYNSHQSYNASNGRAPRQYQSSERYASQSGSYSSRRDDRYPVPPSGPRYSSQTRQPQDDPPRGPRRDSRDSFSISRRTHDEGSYRETGYLKPHPLPEVKIPNRKPSPTRDPRRRSDAGLVPGEASKTVAKPAPPPVVSKPAPPPRPRSYDPDDLSIPLLYCCPSIGSDPSILYQIKASTLYPHLDLRFLSSLGDLSSDLHEASLVASSLSGIRRKCFVTPQGRSSAGMAESRIKLQDEPLIWREAITLEHLEQQLEAEEALVETKLAREITPSTKMTEEQCQATQGDRLARKKRLQVPVAPVAEKGEIQAIQRRETDAISPTVLALEAAAAGMDLEEGEVKESPKQVVRDEASASPTSTRKRHRSDSDGTEDLAEQAHRHRKALEYACKKPRDHCVDRALHGGQPINDSMKQSDDEPILGSRHKGIWSINGEQLHDIPPQIQVLMARALRDVAQPKSLQPYDHPESTKFLNKAAPWFLQLLEPIKLQMEALHASAERKSTDAEAHSSMRDTRPPSLSDSDLVGVAL